MGVAPQLGPVAFDLGHAFWPLAGWTPPPVSTLAACVPGGEGPHPMTEVATAMAGEMLANARSGYATGIAAMLGSANPLNWSEAYRRWYDLVRGRGPWDHKATLRGCFGEWARDADAATEYNFDVWSNLHYGFVGRAAGFREWTLLNGAGFAQWRAGTSPDGYWRRRFEVLGDADVFAAFDDPADQAAIRLGIKLWADTGLGLTAAALIAAVRRVQGLNTRPAR